MIETLQLGLFRDTWQQRFDVWVHTPQGREVANRFIRIAYGCKMRGMKMGAKAIWERLRWNYALKTDQGSSQFKLNNNFHSYMARFAEEREPKLQGYFNKRRLGQRKPKRAVVVPVQ